MESLFATLATTTSSFGGAGSSRRRASPAGRRPQRCCSARPHRSRGAASRWAPRSRACAPLLWSRLPILARGYLTSASVHAGAKANAGAPPASARHGAASVRAASAVGSGSCARAGQRTKLKTHTRGEEGGGRGASSDGTEGVWWKTHGTRTRRRSKRPAVGADALRWALKGGGDPRTRRTVLARRAFATEARRSALDRRLPRHERDGQLGTDGARRKAKGFCGGGGARSTRWSVLERETGRASPGATSSSERSWGGGGDAPRRRLVWTLLAPPASRLEARRCRLGAAGPAPRPAPPSSRAGCALGAPSRSPLLPLSFRVYSSWSPQRVPYLEAR